MADLLISLGANPDTVRMPRKDRPLSAAIRGRHDGLAAALIQSVANFSFSLPEGQFPIHLAVAKSCDGTVRALLAAGCDPNLPFQFPVEP